MELSRGWEDAAGVLLGIYSAMDDCVLTARLVGLLFYHAHLDYAVRNPRLLTVWPVLAGNFGPEVHQLGLLNTRLCDRGWVEWRALSGGGGWYPHVTDDGLWSRWYTMGSPEWSSIQRAAGLVRRLGISDAFRDFGENSIAYQTTPYGEEMVIYSDLLTAEQRATLREKSRCIHALVTGS